MCHRAWPPYQHQQSQFPLKRWLRSPVARDALPTVVGVDDRIETLGTKTRPKRLWFRGSTGARHSFLLKVAAFRGTSITPTPSCARTASFQSCTKNHVSPCRYRRMGVYTCAVKSGILIVSAADVIGTSSTPVLDRCSALKVSSSSAIKNPKYDPKNINPNP